MQNKNILLNNSLEEHGLALNLPPMIPKPTNYMNKIEILLIVHYKALSCSNWSSKLRNYKHIQEKNTWSHFMSSYIQFTTGRQKGTLKKHTIAGSIIVIICSCYLSIIRMKSNKIKNIGQKLSKVRESSLNYLFSTASHNFDSGRLTEKEPIPVASWKDCSRAINFLVLNGYR